MQDALVIAMTRFPVCASITSFCFSGKKALKAGHDPRLMLKHGIVLPSSFILGAEIAPYFILRLAARPSARTRNASFLKNHIQKILKKPEKRPL
jgi:hypothetical protein